MENTELSPAVRAQVRKAQVDEKDGALLYAFMAKREKNPENRRLLEQMARDENQHSNVWQSITEENLGSHTLLLIWMKLLTILLGFTFVVKTMQKNEQFSIVAYEHLQAELPQAARR